MHFSVNVIAVFCVCVRAYACVRACVCVFCSNSFIQISFLSKYYHMYIYIYKNVGINDKHNELHAFSSCIKTFKIAGRLYFVNSTRSLVR